MTRRATFRQSEIKAAIAAADARGKVAVWTPAGIAFLDRDAVPVPPLAQEPPPDLSGLDHVSMKR